MNLLAVLQSGAVDRYHNTLMDRRQKNDAHSWEVAVILMDIYPDTSKDLLFHALTHDCGEIYSSDVSAVAKRKEPKLKEILDKMDDEYCQEVLGIRPPLLSTKDRLALKWADYLSGVYNTTRCFIAGDAEALIVRNKFIEYLNNLPHLNNRATNMIEEFCYEHDDTRAQYERSKCYTSRR